MGPDFSKKTVDTVAKRAGYRCSNPDCGVLTVGPNSTDSQVTLIGEAAHIIGARPNSKRYEIRLTDSARADITNAIWLCRNCHGLIDSDDQRFTSDLLYSWREKHEANVVSMIGNKSDEMLLLERTRELERFAEAPPLVRRIIIDRPFGWEYRLTAELLRYLNKPVFRKLHDLRKRMYVKNQEYLDADQMDRWIHARTSEMSNLFLPFEALFEGLTASWGLPGHPGNVEEIYHISVLLRDALSQVIEFEERLAFANVPDEYQTLVEMLKDTMGSQIKKIQTLPDYLDRLVSDVESDERSTSENPRKVTKTIEFELPSEWVDRFIRERERIERRAELRKSGQSGCLPVFIVMVFLGLLFLIF